jgi:hypothetical protein
VPWADAREMALNRQAKVSINNLIGARRLTSS